MHEKYNFSFAIAHRYKAIYISSHIKDLHVFGIHHIDGVYKRFFRRLYIKKKQNNLTLLGVSKAIRDDIKNSLAGFPSEKIDYLYNSLDFDAMKSIQFSKSEAREKLGLSEKKFIFGNVGRLHDDKDQITLIKAFAQACKSMPNAILVIAGKGPKEGDLSALIKELGVSDKVKLLGMVPEALKYYLAFDRICLNINKRRLTSCTVGGFCCRPGLYRKLMQWKY